MKLIFELRREKITTDGLIPIQVIVRNAGIRIRKGTGLSCKEIYWTGSRVKPGIKKEENNYQFINDELQKIEARVTDIFFFFRANNIAFSKEAFLDKFDSVATVKTVDFDFFECFKEFIDEGKLTKAYNTTRNQNTIKGFLEKFEKDCKLKITFETTL